MKFSRAGAYRDLPVTIACGQCIGCRLERTRQWAVRSVHEASLHDHNCFLTLTYNEEHLPPDGSLDVSHWQLFAKRLRKAFGPFRFFHCGEYGDSNGRPHYHASIFGLDFFDGRVKQSGSGEKTYYTHPGLDQAWGKGYAVFGSLNFQTASYVARYVMKKITGEQATSHYRGKAPEYCTMSRRPGLGKGWIDMYLNEVYPDDFLVINGKKCRPPKFYDEQLQRVSEERYQQLKHQRRSQGDIHNENNTTDRLITRQTVTEARLALTPRSL